MLYEVITLDTALDAMPPEWVAQHALTIGEARGVKTRPFRAFAGISPPEGEAHEGGKEHEHEHEGHDHGNFDPHLWLDPANAAAIANALAERLAIVEPGRAASFRANAERFGASMKALRITSYNVCYTKLLRISTRRHGAAPDEF